MEASRYSLYDIDNLYGHDDHSKYPDELKAFMALVDIKLQEAKAIPREETSKKLIDRYVREAIAAAKLDIDGEGRLGEDRKPYLVSSRTRQQVKALKNVDADGTLPARVNQRYDLSGDFGWYVIGITDSRQSSDESFPVDFLVQNRIMRYGKDQEPSWENVGVLNSYVAHQTIVGFYRTHRGAYGKKLVRDMWKLSAKSNTGDDTTEGYVSSI